MESRENNENQILKFLPYFKLKYYFSLENKEHKNYENKAFFWTYNFNVGFVSLFKTGQCCRLHHCLLFSGIILVMGWGKKKRHEKSKNYGYSRNNSKFTEPKLHLIFVLCTWMT